MDPKRNHDVLTLSTDIRLAYQHEIGAEPHLVFLPGFNSNMFGRKAEYLRQKAHTKGLGFIRFDYRGHGASSGRLEDGSIEEWLEDAYYVLQTCGAVKLLLVGASMGAWIALLIARRYPQKVSGIIGVGGAPDATQPLAGSMGREQKKALAREGITYRASRYGDGDYPITTKMITAGIQHQVLNGDWELRCPLRLLHGLRDPDVPWQQAIEAIERLNCADSEVRLLKDADHRLSDDLHLLAIGRTVEELLEKKG